MTARFIGIGVGPGDPELITLKAARILQEADAVSYLVNGSGHSQAAQIAESLLAQARDGQRHVPITMPMCDDRSKAEAAYDAGVAEILPLLSQGHQVAFLCEGDPLFFGSFAHMLHRIQPHYACEVVPGISSVHAASARAALPLAMLEGSLTVMSGRHSDAQLREALTTHDNVAILKAGRARPRILEAIKAAGRGEEACYFEYVGRANERIVANIDELEAEAGPYFSLFLVSRSAGNSR